MCLSLKKAEKQYNVVCCCDENPSPRVPNRFLIYVRSCRLNISPGYTFVHIHFEKKNSSQQILDKILYDVNKSDIPRKLPQLALSAFLKIEIITTNLTKRVLPLSKYWKNLRQYFLKKIISNIEWFYNLLKMTFFSFLFGSSSGSLVSQIALRFVCVFIKCVSMFFVCLLVFRSSVYSLVRLPVICSYGRSFTCSLVRLRIR
ncbi:hypothetical protein ANN_24581 [Periplaneta americana]|uniref:Uncharacterized protein n=1 Tax=Periplaneta americana TaxID=6978 RepID=A0ABQ8S3R7_PERAM|nr:hypothetical protein ANN_24581 [Periplaneta americana]